uniref:Uncharacterized protein n=1 Tax=Physcomitrium patens TaxID=3218 RepID=A0A2K1KVD1_PHYPA|nr:hypothetical protein PHYPA_004722 [Physcomitrium patens]
MLLRAAEVCRSAVAEVTNIVLVLMLLCKGKRIGRRDCLREVDTKLRVTILSRSSHLVLIGFVDSKRKF